MDRVLQYDALLQASVAGAPPPTPARVYSQEDVAAVSACAQKLLILACEQVRRADCPGAGAAPEQSSPGSVGEGRGRVLSCTRLMVINLMLSSLWIACATGLAGRGGDGDAGGVRGGGDGGRRDGGAAGGLRRGPHPAAPGRAHRQRRAGALLVLEACTFPPGSGPPAQRGGQQQRRL
jgi:hypothetical protein